MKNTLDFQGTNPLQAFEPITLHEMNSAALMNRVDSKYVFNRERLPLFLAWLTESYRVLEINSFRSISYNSVYFDTPQLYLYHQHHCGKKNRLKIRFRNYKENNLTFFEIKEKTNTGRTIKSRIRAAQPKESIDGTVKEFLERETPMHAINLAAVLRIQYQRTTLVHRYTAERVTIDSNIIFKNAYGTINIAHLALAEVKQEKSGSSPFIALMKTNAIREGFISKYCFGMASLMPGLRKNNFKTILSKFYNPQENVH